MRKNILILLCDDSHTGDNDRYPDEKKPVCPAGQSKTACETAEASRQTASARGGFIDGSWKQVPRICGR